MEYEIELKYNFIHNLSKKKNLFIYLCAINTGHVAIKSGKP